MPSNLIHHLQSGIILDFVPKRLYKMPTVTSQGRVKYSRVDKNLRFCLATVAAYFAAFLLKDIQRDTLRDTLV